MKEDVSERVILLTEAKDNGLYKKLVVQL